MPQIRVKLGFAREADHFVKELADAVHLGMSGNAHFPDPPVSMAVLLAATGAYAEARSAAMNGGPADTAAKNRARDAVEMILRQLAGYVQRVSANDLAKLLTSGFRAASTNRARVELSKPHILAVLNAGEGKLKVRVGTVKRARLWMLRYCSEPGVWMATELFPSTRNMVLSGLTPGVLYTIEACALGGKTGASEWSDPVSHRSL